MTTRSALITVMIAAAQKAGRALVRDFGEVEQLQVSKKGPADFVSAADHKAERIVREELSRARPRYGFLMEEAGAITGADTSNRWIVDPLDGTTNFLHGIPHSAVSIALERDAELVAGVVYSPVHDELFWAEKGKGAVLNGRRLRVSARTSLDSALFATGLPFMGRDHGVPEAARPGHGRRRACAGSARRPSIWPTSRPGADGSETGPALDIAAASSWSRAGGFAPTSAAVDDDGQRRYPRRQRFAAHSRPAARAR